MQVIEHPCSSPKFIILRKYNKYGKAGHHQRSPVIVLELEWNRTSPPPGFFSTWI